MESQQKQPDLLVGLTYKKDNGYLCGIIGVSRVVHPQTQLIDALNEIGVNNDLGPVNKTDGVQTWPLALRVFVLQ